VKNRVAVGLCLLWTLGAGSAAADKTTIRELITEPATLVSLGFEWRIDGDDNRNAVVSVSYRKKGEQTWKEGLPLLRIGNERINENALQYVTPNGFAGSIFDLEPATDYECRFVMADPDRIDGRTTQIVSVRTRPEPKPAEGGRTYHVYPPGYNGQKQEPAFTGLLSAYYTGSSHSDNFTGRTWQNLPEFSPKLVSEYAVKVYGSGHVVAYNAISNFHDGVDVATYGNPDGSPNPIRDRLPVSIDFYGNDISNVEDNCLEADGGAHNIRIFRNRCFNHGHRALSVQPAFGGPVYFIRNIVYHAPEGGAVKFTASSAGIVVYHNTLIAPVKPMLLAASNVHYRNNLILGKSETLETFAVETNTNYSSSDYNGFRPNEGAEFSFEWSTPPNSMSANFPGEAGKVPFQQQVQIEAQARERRRFKTLKEFSQATGQDRHSVLVDYDVFVRVSAPGPDPRTLYKPSDFDFHLRTGSAAVDAGVRLPGVNDDFTGRTPDLGAYEVERPLPHYGPRP
jgi:hypothetical protein